MILLDFLLDGFWKPTWLHFGMVLGAKLAPSWHQVAKKADSKNALKTDEVLDRLFYDFSRILASKLERPGNPTNQVFATFLTPGALLRPRWLQDPIFPNF